MPNILHRVGIAAEPMRVFEALTTVEGIRNWWISETTGEATEGAAFQFRKNRVDVVMDSLIFKSDHAEPKTFQIRRSIILINICVRVKMWCAI